MTKVIAIGDRPWALDDVLEVQAGASVALTEAGLARVAAGHAVVLELLARRTPVYGLTRDLGSNRTSVVDGAPAEYQDRIIADHAVGVGSPAPAAIVRGAMAIRLLTASQGGSGMSPAVAQGLERLINESIHPAVPAIGSTGAADLMAMAAIAQVLRGRGAVLLDDVVVPSARALDRVGVSPVGLSGRDGLALVSSNAFTISAAVELISRVHSFLRVAEWVACHSFIAFGANTSPLDELVQNVSGSMEQARVAARMRVQLAGTPTASRTAVQDPVSFRTVPQVHGAAHDVAAYVTRVIAEQLNGSTDNPLIDIRERRAVSNGNFSNTRLAVSIDALRPALMHVAELSDRRGAHLAGVASARSGSERIATYSSAALRAEMRGLCGPASLDVPTLDHGVEDHASGSLLTIKRTGDLLDRAESILAFEVMIAQRAIPTTPTLVTRILDRRLASTTLRQGWASFGDAHEATRRALFEPARGPDGSCVMSETVHPVKGAIDGPDEIGRRAALGGNVRPEEIGSD